MKLVLILAQALCAISICWAQSPRPQARLEAEYYVTTYAQHYRVPVALVRAIVERESHWQACAVSPKGAAGLMQLMPLTAQRLGVTDRCSVDQNVSGGVRYLAWLMQQFHNDFRLVAAAYYAGEDVYTLSPWAHVAIYKKPIAVKEFSAIDDGKGSKPADLVLRPKGGQELVYFTADAERKFFPSYQRNGMDVPSDTWSPSGQIISIEDLNDCQAFVYLPYGTSLGVLRLWGVSPPALRFYFNRQPITVQSASITLGKDRWGHPVYSFAFPHTMTQ